MSEFLPAWEFMRPHEYNHQRNFTNIPGDPGGATMWGITVRALQGHGTLYDLNKDGVVDVADLKLMTEEQSRDEFYKPYYWDAPKLYLLDSQRIASKVFDMGVNLGPARAIMYLQQVIQAFGSKILVDGHLGPVTAKLAASLNEQRVLDGLVLALCDHYTTWVGSNPVERTQFLDGLMARARSLPNA